VQTTTTPSDEQQDAKEALRKLEQAVYRTGAVGLMKQAVVCEQDHFECDVLAGTAPKLLRNLSPDATKSNKPILYIGAIQLKDAGWVVEVISASENSRDEAVAYKAALIETATKYLFDEDEVQAAVQAVTSALDSKSTEEDMSEVHEPEIVVKRNVASVPSIKTERSVVGVVDPVVRIMTAAKVSVGGPQSAPTFQPPQEANGIARRRLG
jgi:hypothetical protein